MNAGLRLALNLGADFSRAAITALGIVVLSFFLIRMVPGDVVDVMGIDGALTYGQQAVLREDLGLTRSWWSQFLDWSGMALSGEFGRSLRYGVPIAQLIGQAMGPTLFLGLTALAIGVVLGITIPMLAAIYPRSPFPALVEFVTIWSITVPTFSIGIVSVIVFAVWLGWIPAIGNYFVPALILGVDTAGTLAKMLHEDLREGETAEYVRTAQAKGLSRARIVVVHMLPNALSVAVAISGLLLAGALTGAITMEVVFGLPGLGTLTLQAIQGRDYPVVQAVVIWLGFAVVLANLVSDALQRLADPRMRRS